MSFENAKVAKITAKDFFGTEID